MPVHSNLRLLLAQVNVKRAENQKPALSLRQLAIESGVAESVITALSHDRNKRIDYETIDKLLSYFSQYIDVDTADLLIWKRD